ncbi:MAG: glycosyltransferase family 2 protein [Modestobacter sp.]|nr:glycosyltransferase family 2 protein [Modestobacter sp.]
MHRDPVPAGAAVTVVIPAYNRAGVIARAIASARAQRPHPPAEIIVVDDRSSDDTAARAASAGARVVRHERNRGAGAARNTAMHSATQPWTAFLDSDDMWLPDHLARALAASDGQVLVSAPGIVLPSSGRSGRLVGNGHGVPVRLRSPLSLLDPENLVATSGTLVSTEAARSAGGFPEASKSEDVDFWIRMLEQGPGLALSEPGYVYCPEEIHASVDATGMREAVQSYLSAYRDRRWYDPRVVRRIAAQDRWDAVRADMADGLRAATLRDLTAIAASPRSAMAIARLLAYRRTARRAGTRAADRLPADVIQQVAPHRPPTADQLT